MKYGILFLIALLFSCHPDKDKKIELDELTVKTTDASELFFKNIRQSDYNTTEMKDAKMLIYKHPDFNDSTIFSVKIAFNWQQDAAYTMIELPSRIQNSDGFELLIRKKGKTERIPFRFGPVSSQIELNTIIYNSLIDGAEFLLESGSQSIPILKSSKEREAFRITMFDYYRLTEIR